MELRQAFGHALKRHRKRKRLSQEDFSDVSSRTYLSSLERGLKSPTLDKIDEIASVIGIHPLTLLVDSYIIKDGDLDLDALFSRLKAEQDELEHRSRGG